MRLLFSIEATLAKQPLSVFCRRPVFKTAIFRPFFYILVFSFFCIQQLTAKFLPMLGFKPQISGSGSNRSANCANAQETSDLYYKNYDGVIMTSYTSKETSMNARHRNLHSSVRRRNYAVVIFIIQATVC